MRVANEHITLSTLAELTGGTIIGDGNISISGVCSIDNPISGHIALALHPSKINWADSLSIPAALIVKSPPDTPDIPCLVHTNPRYAFTIALRKFYDIPDSRSGIEPDACVCHDAEIHPTAYIGHFAVIESKAVIAANVIIGPGCYIGYMSTIDENSLLYPNVTVLHDVSVGKRCIIHSGAVIGSDGFGFIQFSGNNIKVPQVGRVEIHDDVEIGANTTIDRATLDVTRIGHDVKIDNLVQIAHNVVIGPHTRIASQTGIAGRTIIGENVVIAGQAGFQNGITVGDGSIIAGRAGVTRSVEPNTQVSGFPARDHHQALKILAAQNKLPEIIQRLEYLEKLIETKGINK